MLKKLYEIADIYEIAVFLWTFLIIIIVYCA